MSLALSQIDAAIVVVYFIATVGLGLWIGRGSNSAAEYLLGGRNIPWWAVLLSIVATETSTVTFLSVPGLAFDPKQGDLRFLQLAIGLFLGRCVIVRLFLPHYFRGELFTAYEVLQRRFGGSVKQTASLLFLVTRNLADGLRLYLTAVVLERVSGLDLSICVVVLGVVTIVYTFFGGMKSVVWTDCIQFAVYMLGALVAGWLILQQLPGGWDEYLRFAHEQHKLRLVDLSFDLREKYTLWSGVLGGIFLSLATHGTDQLMVQRYLCARSESDAARALVASGAVVFAQFAVFLLVGVGLACYYTHYPPSIPFARNDEVFATFIVTKLPVGAVGLTLAAILAAAMSTLSSSLNSSATAALHDFYLPARKTAPSSGHVVAMGRLLTVVFGVVQIGVGIAGQYATNSVVDNVLAIAGFATGLILGVFFLGVLTHRVTERSALAGLVGGLAIMIAVKFYAPLAGTWYAVVGSLSTFGIGMAASYLFPSQPAGGES